MAIRGRQRLGNLEYVDPVTGQIHLQIGPSIGVVIPSGGTLDASAGTINVGTVSLADGVVTAAKIGTGAVIAAKLGALAVETAAINTGAVTTGKIAASAVTTTELGAAAVSAAKLGANLAKGFIPLDLAAARKIVTNNLVNIAGSGGILATDTTPILERVNGATDPALRISWVAADVIPVQWQFAYPPDLDDAAAVVVHLQMAKNGNTDNAMVVGVGYFEGVGDTNAGANTAALAASALSEKTVTIALGDVGPYPTFASVILTPGTHANDALYLYGAHVEYTRRT